MPKGEFEKEDETNDAEFFDVNEYLPYIMDVTESMEEYARIHLNETPENRERCVEELKERIKSEKDLDSRMDDLFLLNFLRSKRFNVESAFRMIQKYYLYLESHRHIFCNHKPAAALRLAKSNIIGFLPYRDKNDRAILVIRAAAWDPYTFPADQVIYGGVILLKTFLEMPANQITGFVAIVDCKHLNLKQIISIIPRYSLFVAQGLQHCCPCKVQSIHIVNVPEVFRLAWKLIKRVLSDKIKTRITIYKGSGYEGLQQHVPKAVLPEELDGDAGSMKNENWIRNIEKIQMEYDIEVSHGYKSLMNRRAANKSKNEKTTINLCQNTNVHEAASAS